MIGPNTRIHVGRVRLCGVYRTNIFGYDERKRGIRAALELIFTPRNLNETITISERGKGKMKLKKRGAPESAVEKYREKSERCKAEFAENTGKMFSRNS